MSRSSSLFRLPSAAPKAYLFTRLPASRHLSTTTRSRASDDTSSPPAFGSFQTPHPPRLPKEEQEVFETLQRQSTGAFSTPRAPPKINQSPDSSTDEVKEAEVITEKRKHNIESEAVADASKREIEARGKGEELHPNVRRGAPPEFEGDTNPKTGEVGGPRNEPLRWGAAGEWSYNGRTTDF